MKASAIREQHAAASGPSRRQSARQQRTTATRPANYYARPFALRGTLGGADNVSTNTTAPGFFPAITHFTDSITALPKEVMKHFSMLKEVEAKTYQPDDELQKLAEQVSQLHAPTRREAQLAAQNVSNATGNNSVNGSTAGSATQSQTPANQQQTSTDLLENANNGHAMDESSVLARRELFLRYRYGLSQMCAMLDEKNAVLSSANQTMDKQLSRMESSFQHIDEELSFEARYGSFSHWAYKDSDDKKKTTNERSRRDVAAANNLAAAAAAVHEGDIAASRSEARREALLAKQRSRNHYVDSEFEDSRPTKKPPTHRGKKVVDSSVGPPDSRIYGLGITNGPGQTTKRRKTEKAAAGAPAMERSLSGAMHNAQGGRASPRETPAAEGGKKRSRAAPVPTAAKKRYGDVQLSSVVLQNSKEPSRAHAVGAQSPQGPSSPVIGTFAHSGSNAQRPQSSRARQNSTTNSTHSNNQDNPRNRPPSSASNRAVNGAINTLETEQSVSGGGSASATRPTAEPSAPANGNHSEHNMKREDTEMQDGSGTPAQTVVTRAGRTSKTATPVIGSFPSDVPMARSRSTRNNGSSHASSESNVPLASTQSQKRSHKKGASALQQSHGNHLDDGSSLAGDLSGPDMEEDIADDDEDGDQERFCYCDGVSYGEMIGCDNPDCTRQWFHYACVGITKEPNKKAKWYCNECKENMKRSRPGSRQ